MLKITADPTADIQVRALPGEWKESSNNPYPDYGFNNQLKCKSDQDEYYVRIRALGNLTSPGNPDISPSNLKYMCTYVNFYDDSSKQSSEGQGTKYNYRKYVDLLASYQNVYLATFDESQVSSDEVQPQFRYAVLVPDDQPPGTYTGQIQYQVYDVSGGSGPTTTVNVSLEVSPMFQISIDRSTIDFEEMLPGHEKENIPVEGIIVTSKVNTGNPWYIKISNNSPLTFGPNIIPNKYFKWYGWTDGAGRWHGTGEDPLSLTTKLVYSSGAGEGNNLPGGTNNHLKFKLKIPSRQKSGKYISRVRVTMTE